MVINVKDWTMWVEVPLCRYSKAVGNLNDFMVKCLLTRLANEEAEEKV